MNTLQTRLITTSVCLLGIGALAATLSPRAKSTTSAPVPVVVQNTPLPVADTLAAQQPFSKRLDLSFSNNFASQTFTVPAGKRLVITFVSADAGVVPGAHVLLDVTTVWQGHEVESHIPMTPQGVIIGRETFACSQPTTIYADPGSIVNIAALDSDSSSNGGLIVGVYGYLVPTV